MATTQSGFLTLAAAAQDLGVCGDAGPLQVARLCATRRLVGHRVKTSGTRPAIADWRVSGANIARFIEAGAQGLPGPAIDDQSGWIDDCRSEILAERFADAVRSAIAAAAPTEAELGRRALEADLVEVQLNPVGGILAVLNAAPPKGASWDPSPIASFWADIWAATMLRERMQTLLRREMAIDARPALQRLFSSAEEFDRLTGAAYDELRASRIGTGTSVRVWPRGRGGLWRDVPVRLYVAASTFLRDRRALALAAF